MALSTKPRRFLDGKRHPARANHQNTSLCNSDGPEPESVIPPELKAAGERFPPPDAIWQDRGRDGKRDRQQLIGPAGCVITVLAVDDIEEISFIAVPETLVKGLLAPDQRELLVRVIFPVGLLRFSHCCKSLSALYHSPFISTAFPRRGVTTQSSTLASIQVSW